MNSLLQLYWLCWFQFFYINVQDEYACLEFFVGYCKWNIFPHPFYLEKKSCFGEVMVFRFFVQEYGIKVEEKLHISQSICTPLMRKIHSDLLQVCQQNAEEESTRLNSKLVDVICIYHN